jgi:hypothetical protein
MSVDLVNDAGRCCHLNGSAWFAVLFLAEAFGWKPAGTVRLLEEMFTEYWTLAKCYLAL